MYHINKSFTKVSLKKKKKKKSLTHLTKHYWLSLMTTCLSWTDGGSVWETLIVSAIGFGACGAEITRCSQAELYRGAWVAKHSQTDVRALSVANAQTHTLYLTQSTACCFLIQDKVVDQCPSVNVSCDLKQIYIYMHVILHVIMHNYSYYNSK